jgi:hypothetical protein
MGAKPLGQSDAHESLFAQGLRRLADPGAAGREFALWYQQLASMAERRRNEARSNIAQSLAVLQCYACAWRDCPDPEPLYFWLPEPAWNLWESDANGLALIHSTDNRSDVPVEAVKWSKPGMVGLAKSAQDKHVRRILARINDIGETSIINAFMAEFMERGDALRAVAFLEEGLKFDNLLTIAHGRRSAKRRAIIREYEMMGKESQSVWPRPDMLAMISEPPLGIRLRPPSPRSEPAVVPDDESWRVGQLRPNWPWPEQSHKSDD